MDLLGEYWVTVELRSFVIEQDDPMVTEAFGLATGSVWKPPNPPSRCSTPWVDWFEDLHTAEIAFSAVVGDDVRAMKTTHRLRDLATGPLHRRVVRVLEHSGPVRWAAKRDVYGSAAQRA